MDFEERKGAHQMIRGRKNRETNAEVQYQAAHLDKEIISIIPARLENAREQQVPGRQRPLSSESPVPKAEPGTQRCSINVCGVSE